MTEVVTTAGQRRSMMTAICGPGDDTGPAAARHRYCRGFTGFTASPDEVEPEPCACPCHVPTERNRH